MTLPRGAELGVHDRTFLQLKGGQERYRDYDSSTGPVLCRTRPVAAPMLARAMMGNEVYSVEVAADAEVAPVEIGQGGLIE